MPVHGPEGFADSHVNRREAKQTEPFVREDRSPEQTQGANTEHHREAKVLPSDNVAARKLAFTWE